MKKSHITALILALAALPLLVLMGCSNNPIGTDATLSNQAGDFFSLSWPEGGLGKSAVALETLATLETDMSSNSVEPQTGGTVPVALPSAAAGTFKVEPASIADTATIAIETTELTFNDGTKAVVFECGPDGLVFNPTATLTVSAGVLGTGVKSVSLLWLNETTGQWEVQGRYRVKLDGTVSLPIGHFSKYGISR